MPQILFFIYTVCVGSSDLELAVKQRIFHFWCPTRTWDYPSQRPLLHNRRHKGGGGNVQARTYTPPAGI